MQDKVSLGEKTFSIICLIFCIGCSDAHIFKVSSASKYVALSGFQNVTVYY